MQSLSDSQAVNHGCDGTSIPEVRIDAIKAMVRDSPIRRIR
jgi:hypothetical protein